MNTCPRCYHAADCRCGLRPAVARCPDCGERYDGSDPERWLSMHKNIPSLCDLTARLRKIEREIGYWNEELHHARRAAARKAAA